VNDYKVRVGAQIRRARNRHGWSQNELARRTGIPELTGSQVSRWERGEAMPNPRNFEALERALGIKLIPDGDDDDSETSWSAAWLSELLPAPHPA
jgi:transcriptional regulator with XRE-family HTH domain